MTYYDYIEIREVFSTYNRGKWRLERVTVMLSKFQTVFLGGWDCLVVIPGIFQTPKTSLIVKKNHKTSYPSKLIDPQKST